MTALEDGARHGVAREFDDAIRAVVVRLSRPHASGGDVIERAAIQPFVRATGIRRQ